jgi:hypothetical protein
LNDLETGAVSAGLLARISDTLREVGKYARARRELAAERRKPIDREGPVVEELASRNGGSWRTYMGFKMRPDSAITLSWISGHSEGGT